MTKPRRGPSNADTHVGKMIRQHRLIAGLSQDKLGQALGVTFQQIQKYEKGINRVGAGTLPKIAEALLCKVQDLLPPSAAFLESGEGNALRDLMATRDGIRLSQAFSALPQHLRTAALQMIEAMAGPR